jgi:ABC-2 type transport system permease protein
MMKFFKIVIWELKLRLISKNFLFASLVLPVFFICLVYIPLINIEEEKPIRIGFIDATPYNIFPIFNSQLTDHKLVKLQFSQIKSDTSENYLRYIKMQENVQFDIDTILNRYNLLKKEREDLFVKRKKTKEDKQRILDLYIPQIAYKNRRDSLNIVQEDLSEQLVKSYAAEAKVIANKLLNDELLDAYIYLEPNVLESGKVEFHSLVPGNFILQDQIEHAINIIIVQNRLALAKVRPEQSKKILRPLEFKSLQLKGNNIEISQTYANFYGPIIGLLLLFTAVFSSVGHLFSGIIQEKNKRILEFVLNTMSKKILFNAKLIAMSFFGLIQILVWFIILFFMVQVDLFGLSTISFLTMQNFGFFILYYGLAYFFFASLVSGLSVVFSSESESSTMNLLIRILAITPLVFSLIILENPNSGLVSGLSYFPFFSPAFMIMRIELSSTLPIMDIKITSAILFFFIILLYFASYRLFNSLAIYYGKRLSFKEILKVIKTGKL